MYYTTNPAFFQGFLERFLTALKDPVHDCIFAIPGQDFQSANPDSPKCKNCTLEEMAIIKIMNDDPTVTQKQIAELTGRSERWVKSRTVEMQEKGLISRENGKRSGKWVVNE